MFDELKKSKVTEFKSCNVKCLKEIKRLKSLQKQEAYLEPQRASMMELFVNILNVLLFSQ